MSDLLDKLNNRKGLLNDVTRFVKDEMEKENIPSDAKYAIIAGADEQGLKFMASVKIVDKEKMNLRVAALWDHDWEGDDSAAMKIILTGK